MNEDFLFKDAEAIEDDLAIDCAWFPLCEEKVRVDIVFANKRLISERERSIRGYCSICAGLLWSTTKRVFRRSGLRRFFYESKARSMISASLEPWQHKTPSFFDRGIR